MNPSPILAEPVKKRSLMENQQFNCLNSDLLTQILSRVDGPTLASATCACLDLRSVAHEEQLWEALCNSMWPSTSGKETQVLISSMGGNRKFFADSYPLIVYRPVKEEKQTVPDSPSDFVSLIDVYYKEKCIYSKVVLGIPDAGDGDNYHGGWFSECPFKIDLPNLHDDDVVDGVVPSMLLVDKKQRGCRKFCRELEEKVRLSWVIVNLKRKKAANLSSWKPLLVQKNWPSEGDLLMRFGCVIPAEGVLDSKSAQCVISMKCRVLKREGLKYLKWRKISMQVEDLEGAHVNGRKSLTVIDRALGCHRSRNQGKVAEGYQKFLREQKELMERRRRRETLADRLSAFCAMAAFLSFCFYIM